MENFDSQIKPQWQSLKDRERADEYKSRSDEFPPGAEVLEVKGGVDRRNFLGLFGASMALTGAVTTGCIRKPKQIVHAYVNRPENLVPGKSRYFASALSVAGQVCGILARSYDGRPVKIEGNPDHPGSLGATNHFAQAEVLRLYDPDRFAKPLQNGKEVTFDEAKAALVLLGQKLSSAQGGGVAVVSDWMPSPTAHRLLASLAAKWPQAKFYRSGESCPVNESEGLASIGLEKARLHHSLKGSKVIVALDADPLGLEGESIRLTREFANGRRVRGQTAAMNRLYAVESHFSVTGANADNRLLVSAGSIEDIVIDLARELDKRGMMLGGAGSELTARLGPSPATERHGDWIRALADDLVANRGKSVLFAGYRQPSWVHALVFAMNEALGNLGQGVTVYSDGVGVDFAPLADFARDVRAGSVSTAFVLGGNPAYTAPGELGFADLLSRVETTVGLLFEVNETSEVCQWVIPQTHDLESWGDFFNIDGTVALRQPLIEPLFSAISEIEFLGLVSGDSKASSYGLVRESFQSMGESGSSESAWKKALMEGVAPYKAFTTREPAANYAKLALSLRQHSPKPAGSAQALDVVFPLDYKTYDGRYANNAWLQELPDPVTKLTWDNALLLAPSTAAALDLKDGDSVELSAGGQVLTGAALVQPGVAPGTAVFARGYGRRTVGRVGKEAGFDVSALRKLESPDLVTGAQVKATGGTYLLAKSQLHSSMEGRPIVRESTLEGYRKEPNFVEKYEVMPKEKIKSFLWKEPNTTTGQQWGMTIDLTSCTGCNACVVACQSENNVAIVGKKEVARHRHMAWIRVDNYFTGSIDDPEMVHQPVNCMHCETAPCEGVCPVGATIHSPEGMNDMAYNRCIGTRYCANNCPYKVRKFNYFNFSKRQDEMNPLLAMQQNPNVTIRFRGVIEKCSYCVQRVNEARIDAKLKGDGVIRDGAVQTACQQVCPAGAIEFGDVANPDSGVSKAKQEPHNYGMLAELNTRPRTTYLAKLRNPNASLV